MGEKYGVTPKGFVLKRMDTILDEIHTDLAEDFGFDTRVYPKSFLNVLVTTFGNQIAELWEEAQNSYFTKYPSTAERVNLDNAVQYGGIRRQKQRQTVYKIHCTGIDGTLIAKSSMIASDTNPEIELVTKSAFMLTRESFNSVRIKVAAVSQGEKYTVTINEQTYSISSESGADESSILNGLVRELSTCTDFAISFNINDKTLDISDLNVKGSNYLGLSDNLTTANVTTIHEFCTANYGEINLPNETITIIKTAVNGFQKCVNLIAPTLGRELETDVELRQSYLYKSAIRSTRMIDSITSSLINNVDGVETAAGFQNDTNEYDKERRPPHSIEIVVDGGDETEIATIIFDKKAAGIQTVGDVVTQIDTEYGDTVAVRFNRPIPIYAYLNIAIEGKLSSMQSNYVSLVKKSVMNDVADLAAGDSLLSQNLLKGIYESVSGINYIAITIAIAYDTGKPPGEKEYYYNNVIVSSREKVYLDESRIEVQAYEAK